MKFMELPVMGVNGRPARTVLVNLDQVLTVETEFTKRTEVTLVSGVTLKVLMPYDEVKILLADMQNVLDFAREQFVELQSRVKGLS